MNATQVTSILRASSCQLPFPGNEITTLLTDSRRLVEPEGVVFFAITTKHDSGCNYVEQLYRRGVRNFIVPPDCPQLKNAANVWVVDDVVAALQRLATWHREQYDMPVVGITGSNGKTIVKDWIVQLLSDRHVAASPKSFNSQIGVPLSVWQMTAAHDMAVFEAGISETGEMLRLQKIIRPTIGIFTNIGQAHDENFLTRQQKVAEKLQLFTHCDTLIYCSDHKDIHSVVLGIESFHRVRRFTWGSDDESDLQVLSTVIENRKTTLMLRHNDEEFSVTIPFFDRASRENAMHCIALMLYLGYSPSVVAERCGHLMPVEMRLEMNEGVNNCLIINDSYSLDLNSLSIALDFLQQETQHYRKVLIITDFMQSGVPEEELYRQVANLISHRGVTDLLCIGETMMHNQNSFAGLEAHFFTTTTDFLNTFDFNALHDSTILLKGARKFGLERVAKLLYRRQHETVMEVNLSALSHNLDYYRSRLHPQTRVMAMVKAASYGAGTVEVAAALQRSHADYLTVAYADEGVELRRNGITLPIMVMNPEESSFDDIIRHGLEPDVYSFRILDLINRHAALYETSVAVHIELDTGMHRLGFGESDIDELAKRLQQCSARIHVGSIFSHLAGSDDPNMDAFTRMQISRFSEWNERLIQKTDCADCPPLRHILNSSGIARFPEAQFDMVRLGIGLYGMAAEPEVRANLQQVSRLLTRISQIKTVPQGDTVGYNQGWRASRPSRIAILPIGYADGLNRRLSNGGRVALRTGDASYAEAPIVGNICMDMCFVDVTDIPCQEGDVAIVFGHADLLQRNASAAQTITYELLTSVAPRVKRVYVY